MTNGYSPSDSSGGAPEPGEVDNRLSLVPDQFPDIADWQDGEEYDLSEIGKGVKIRQISAGEFEVMPPMEAEAETPAEDASAGEETEMPMKVSKPVRAMMMK